MSWKLTGFVGQKDNQSVSKQSIMQTLEGTGMGSSKGMLMRKELQDIADHLSVKAQLLTQLFDSLEARYMRHFLNGLPTKCLRKSFFHC